MTSDFLSLKLLPISSGNVHELRYTIFYMDP